MFLWKSNQSSSISAQKLIEFSMYKLSIKYKACNYIQWSYFDTNYPEYNRTLNVMGSLNVGNKGKVSFTV